VDAGEVKKNLRRGDDRGIMTDRDSSTYNSWPYTRRCCRPVYDEGWQLGLPEETDSVPDAGTSGPGGR
jgi:hypothetical protein